ncbi:MAG TPA: CRISPR-associated protein Csx20 [bacterium]|jgi:hypothetical protein|nr:CRISPR-associated protein Csx20 [bacterium]HPG36701.1 CRISPR-associated protein Csx20 [bacterium]HPM47865.1 CRISPR-associated protein Csx20 [bacterium]HQM85023.1 CRISPR-associated protein Csx20 [bacterium]HRQ69252.1 CRISPR-associated protein Csx20 [bacterium]
MSNLFLLFSHTLTPEQVKDANEVLGVEKIVSLPLSLQQMWSDINPVGELNTKPLEEILLWLKEHASKGDFVLIQGEFGATHYLIEHCFNVGIIPIYATSKRIYEEIRNGDGTVERKHIFKHVNFRRYVKWGEKY